MDIVHRLPSSKNEIQTNGKKVEQLSKHTDGCLDFWTYWIWKHTYTHAHCERYVVAYPSIRWDLTERHRNAIANFPTSMTFPMMTIEIRFHSNAANEESKTPNRTNWSRRRAAKGNICYVLLSFHMLNTQ